MIGSIERLSVANSTSYNQRVSFSYPTAMLSPVGNSYIQSIPSTPGYSSVPVPFSGPYSSPQSPAAGYTTGGYGTPTPYGTTSVPSEISRLTTPTARTWNNSGNPINGSLKDESYLQVGLYGRRQNSARHNAVRSVGRPSFSSAAGQHNVVDVDRIRQGLDVRTTVSFFRPALSHLLIWLQIMLRNIPNKIDQEMLKGIIDETSFGSYDFMYLRIDFANNCKYVILTPIYTRTEANFEVLAMLLSILRM